MRFKSRKIGGYRAYAVTGVNTVSFAIDFRDADTSGLLGFAVERHDPAEDERYFIYGMKVFESVIPNPDELTTASTFDQPVQSFVWDDFTAKPDRDYEYFFHPLKGHQEPRPQRAADPHRRAHRAAVHRRRPRRLLQPGRREQPGVRAGVPEPEAR